MSKIKFTLKTDKGTMNFSAKPDTIINAFRKKGKIVNSTFRADSIKEGDEIYCFDQREKPKLVLLIE